MATTTLHYLCATGEKGAVKAMLQYSDYKLWTNILNAKDENGETPLNLAEQRGFLELVHLLQTSRSEDGWHWQHQGNLSQSEIVDIITDMFRRDSAEALQWFKLLQMKKKAGYTLLHLASDRGDTTLLTQIKNAVSVEQWYKLLQIKDEDKLTPLHVATDRGHTGIVELFERSLRSDQWYHLLQIKDNDDDTPLHIAAGLGYTEIMRTAQKSIGRDQWYNLLRIKAMNDYTPLHLAAARGHTEVVKLLGKPITSDQWYVLLKIEDKAARTPLYYATEQDTIDIVDAMQHKLRADQWYQLLQIKGDAGYTLLHLIAQRSDSEMVTQFNKHVCSDQWYDLLSVKTNEGETPLTIVANKDNVDDLDTMVRSLLCPLSADCQSQMKIIQMRNKQGLNALHISVSHYSSDNGTCTQTIKDVVSADMWIDLLSIPLPALKRCGFTKEKYTAVSRRLDNYKDDALIHKASTITDHTGSECFNYVKDNLLIHRLAQGNKLPTIKTLMSKLTGKQRIDLLEHRDAKGKTPYQKSSNTVRTLFRWIKRQQGFYFLPTPPTVLIMYSTENREGAEEECRDLLSILPKFNVKTTVKKNLTKDEMMQAIRDAQDQDDQLSALIVIVMCHGQKGAIWARDGAVNIDKLLLQMNSGKVNGKPKVLLIQACQDGSTALADQTPRISYDDIGSLRDETHPANSQIFQDTAAGYDARANEFIDNHFELRKSDFMVLIATVSGSRAERNMMIPLFAKNLSMSGDQEDLYEVFLKTNQDIEDNTNADQVAEFRSTLKRKLCLRSVFDPNISEKPSLLDLIGRLFGFTRVK